MAEKKEQVPIRCYQWSDGNVREVSMSILDADEELKRQGMQLVRGGIFPLTTYKTEKGEEKGASSRYAILAKLHNQTLLFLFNALPEIVSFLRTYAPVSVLLDDLFPLPQEGHSERFEITLPYTVRKV